MTYDYKAGRDRIEEILDSNLKIIESKNIPCENDFTFENAYKTWITAIFVDIRNSTTLFTKENKKIASKIIRCFTSEIIEVLNDYELEEDPYGSIEPEEIGIRGDCVYAIYSTPKRSSIQEILNRAFYINTLLNMLNKIFTDNNYININAGIGVSTAEEVIIKAGRKYSGVNSKVWIGDAVTKASKLSSICGKNSIKNIAISSCTHHNIIDDFKIKNGESSESWFTKVESNNFGTYFHCDITKSKFNKWIKDGMND